MNEVSAAGGDSVAVVLSVMVALALHFAGSGSGFGAVVLIVVVVGVVVTISRTSTSGRGSVSAAVDPPRSEGCSSPWEYSVISFKVSYREHDICPNLDQTQINEYNEEK